jgi:hypothetical protein
MYQLQRGITRAISTSLTTQTTNSLKFFCTFQPNLPQLLPQSRQYSSTNFLSGPDHGLTTDQLIEKLAGKTQTSVSLNTLMETGRGDLLSKHTNYNDSDTAATEKILRQVATFLNRELPIRFAHRINDLNRVPMMKDQPSVLQVKEWYITSMTELYEFRKVSEWSADCGATHFTKLYAIFRLRMRRTKTILRICWRGCTSVTPVCL